MVVMVHVASQFYSTPKTDPSVGKAKPIASMARGQVGTEGFAAGHTSGPIRRMSTAFAQAQRTSGEIVQCP